MDDLKKKYKHMENVLNTINSKAIALQEHEKKRNNKILDQITSLIIKLMKEQDPLFKAMYERNFYGGSYYDNLKVGNPNEYDLDLVLNIPVLIEPCVRCSEQPGFVRVEIKEYSKIVKRPEIERKKFEKINTLLDSSNFLSTNRVLKWMESIINVALNEMPKEGNETFVDVILDKDKEDQKVKIFVKLSRYQPAFTMKLTGKDINGSDILLDIDLVPCFQFNDKNNWPSQDGGYRCNPSTLRNKFLVVPKKPKGEIENSPYLETYWRLSFQEQERELMDQNLRNFKPSLRLLKKLRDRHNHKIASYFIKTIFLWTLEEEPQEFWRESLSIVFMAMLKKYADRIREKKIPYYWNNRFNLIDYLKDSTKTDLANTLHNIIADINRNLMETNIDPFKVGKYLLPIDEFEKFKDEVTIGKKLGRSMSMATTSAALNNNSLSVDTTDSTSDNSPPLVTTFKFDQAVADSYKHYSDLLEEKQKKCTEDIKAQLNNRSNGTLNANEILTYFQKIDEKMDKLLEKFNEIQAINKNTDLRVSTLEGQVRELQMEKKEFSNKLNESTSNS